MEMSLTTSTTTGALSKFVAATLIGHAVRSVRFRVFNPMIREYRAHRIEEFVTVRHNDDIIDSCMSVQARHNNALIN